ncbi:MAG: SPOR domain-containing protein [Gemmatimonadales bacterium]
MNTMTRIAIAWALATLPANLAAQDTGMPMTPVLLQVIRLAQDGFGDSARTTVARIIDRTPATDPLYPEALYTAATVSKSGEEMRLLFSRVSVEYSRSPWADNALLRLAQLDYGAGNLDGVLARVNRIMSDYPGSPVIPVAAMWGSRAAFERRQMATGCDWIARGHAAAGNDVETRNQLEYARVRCTNVPPENAPIVAAPVPPPANLPAPSTTTVDIPVSRGTTTPAARPASGGWRVQVGALRDAAAIRRTRTAIERAGFTSYVLPATGGLTKVQAGPFATRESAMANLAKVKAAVNGDAFVTRAPIADDR